MEGELFAMFILTAQCHIIMDYFYYKYIHKQQEKSHELTKFYKIAMDNFNPVYVSNTDIKNQDFLVFVMNKYQGPSIPISSYALQAALCIYQALSSNEVSISIFSREIVNHYRPRYLLSEKEVIRFVNFAKVAIEQEIFHLPRAVTLPMNYPHFSTIPIKKASRGYDFKAHMQFSINSHDFFDSARMDAPRISTIPIKKARRGLSFKKHVQFSINSHQFFDCTKIDASRKTSKSPDDNNNCRTRYSKSLIPNKKI